MKLTLEHIGLPARNPVALKDWYVRSLGAAIHFQGPDGPPFLLSLPGNIMMFEIYGAERMMPEVQDNKLGGWRHLAIRVDSIEAARAELQDRGVKFTDGVKPAAGGGQVLFFQDPEGNLLHLVERPTGV